MFELKVPDLRRSEATVEAYEADPVQPGMILFYGSSGFTRWKPKYNHRPLEEDIRMKDGSPAAVNHGFGGATMEEGLYYYDRLVKPWAPRAIVTRFYPNDINAGYSPAEILYLHAQFVNRAKADFPGVKLYLCDAMPHLRFRENGLWKVSAKKFNAMLREYCDKTQDVFYVSQSGWRGFYNDPADAGDYSKVRDDIWVEDQMHMTQEGYDSYRDLFLEALDDIL